MMSMIRRHTKPKYKRCAFTGHRIRESEESVRCTEMKAQLRRAIEELIEKGYAHFISGGTIGMDMFAAEMVLELQKEYPWILLEMVSPFDTQSAKWEKEYQMRLDRLYASADIITATGHDYTRSSIFRRNRYLVDNADLLLADFGGKPGGTAMTCSYAAEIGIPVENLTTIN